MYVGKGVRYDSLQDPECMQELEPGLRARDWGGSLESPPPPPPPVLAHTVLRINCACAVKLILNDYELYIIIRSPARPL